MRFFALPMRKHRTPPFGGDGFTLLEMSIVIAIVAVVIGGGLTIFAASLSQKQRAETQGRLMKIQETLLAYRRFHHKLPCPGSATVAFTHVDYGKAAPDGGNCRGGSPVATFISGEIVAGALPVKELGLPDEYGLDAWGRRIFYAVDRRLTATDAFNTVPVTDTTTRITILDMSGGSKTTRAAYALVSFGENGHGAYPRSGGTTRMGAGSTNSSEWENCDCDSTGVDTGFNTTFSQRPPTESTSGFTDSFDDMAVFATRADLSSPTDY